MIFIESKKIKPSESYQLLISAVIPRPIAWVSTVSGTGVSNLAPFSFFTGVGSNPPTLLISIAKKSDGSMKDTLKNILETREFVVNSSSGKDTRLINLTSEEIEGSEFETFGVESTPSRLVKPPGVVSSFVRMECKLVQTVEIGSVTLAIGEIAGFQLSEEVYKDGNIDAEKLDPVSRLGGMKWGALGKVFTLARPKRS